MAAVIEQEADRGDVDGKHNRWLHRLQDIHEATKVAIDWNAWRNTVQNLGCQHVEIPSSSARHEVSQISENSTGCNTYFILLALEHQLQLLLGCRVGRINLQQRLQVDHTLFIPLQHLHPSFHAHSTVNSHTVFSFHPALVHGTSVLDCAMVL